MIQAKESTLGNKRQVFLLGSPPGGTSTLRVPVLAEKGAHITGTFAAASLAVPLTVANQPLTAGPGGRAMLTFAVPNSIAPPRGSHAAGTLTVQSTFRGATLTRNLTVTFGRR